jgi:myo-inositol 2-dehydrogenase/D-chiro-inositol 1-dehydrogenase
MIGFALFGAGRIGAMHAANVAANPRSRLHCVFDVHTATAERVAAAHGAKAVASVAAALADPAVDAVLIASSTDTHVELITAAAKAGKPVLCEKPIDLDIKRVEQCRRDIANTGVPVQLGFNRRYDASHRAVRDAVRHGDIGTLQLLVITSRDPAIAPMEYMKVSGGIFRDMTIHDFDLARFVLGEDPTEVFATGSVMIEPALRTIGDVDTAMVVLKAPSGALVHINNSRTAVYGYDQRVEAFGSKGMVLSENWRATSLRRWTHATTEAQDQLLHFFIQRYAQAYVDELNAFIDIVTNKAMPEVDFEDGRKALIIADAAWESVHTGRSVKVTYG